MSALTDTRNALFVPVGDNQSHIQVAAVTHVGYDDVMTAGTWTAAEEKLHPRDSEGKFTEKGFGTAGKIADLLKHVIGAKNGSVVLSGKTKSGMRVRIAKLYGNQYHIQVRESSESKWETTATLSGESELKNYLGKASANWETPGMSKTVTSEAPKKSMPPLLAPTKVAAKAAPSKFAGKPYVNTNVIYKQKYSDGQIVAEHAGIAGQPKQLVWNAGTKKFDLKVNSNGSWFTTASYGKGDAYQKLSKQEGWHAPGAAAEETAVAAGPKPLHINTNVIYKQKYVDQQVVAEKPAGATGNKIPQRLLWDAKKKKFLRQGQTPTGTWITADEYGKGKAYQKFSKETGWQTPAAPITAPLAAPSTSPTLKPTVTPGTLAAPPLPPAVKPHGYAQHEQVTQAIKFVGDIGKPKTNVKTFKNTTSAGMVEIQEKSKSSWTSAQTKAIDIYTEPGTSSTGGYQAINAVLRGDESRLKLFSEKQLKQAAANAQFIQDSMAPLAESLELHRGTGAQQFGFPNNHVSTADLKKFEGKIIQDRGFVSTSVISPKEGNIPFDYGKKPIKIIVRAPEGTPAVYVSSVLPYQSQNELVLGAGTSFHVADVHAPSPAEKKLYGDQTEQVVILEVVPTIKKLEPKPLPGVALAPVPNAAPAALSTAVTPTLDLSSQIAGFTPGTPSSELNAFYSNLTQYQFNALTSENKNKLEYLAKTENIVGGNAIPQAHLSKLQTKAATPSSVSTPLKSQGSPAGTPIKLNTKVIHTTKYADGVIVAVKPNLTGGLNQRLVWSENTKKFVLQEEKTPGNWASLAPGFGEAHFFTKKDAYNKFSKETGWVTPEPGTKAHGTGYPFGSAATPSVSATVKAPTAVPIIPYTPSTSAVKSTVMDAAILQKMHGDISAFTLGRKNYLFTDFREHSTVGSINLSSHPINMFTALKETVDKHNASASHQKINALQLLKIIDEKLNNGGMYEKKIADWLQTPSGKSAATKIWADPAVSVAALPGGVDAVPEPSTIGVPSTTAKVFPTLSVSQAQAMQNQMNKLKPWTNAQQDALTAYTGYDHVYMNAALRQAGPGWPLSADEAKKWRDVAKNAQAGMRPAPQSFTVYRRAERDSLPGMTSASSIAEIKALQKKVISDAGFGSTSIDPNKWSGSVRYIIEVPEGTPVAWVDAISENPEEYEIMLAAGTKYYVQRVEQPDIYSDSVDLYVRVVP